MIIAWSDVSRWEKGRQEKERRVLRRRITAVGGSLAAAAAKA